MSGRMAEERGRAVGDENKEEKEKTEKGGNARRRIEKRNR
jgi:hypothetical protein